MVILEQLRKAIQVKINTLNLTVDDNERSLTRGKKINKTFAFFFKRILNKIPDIKCRTQEQSDEKRKKSK